MSNDTTSPRDGDKTPGQGSWFHTRTLEEETSRDVLSAVCFKYFAVLIGAIFAILLAKPETASGVLIWKISIRSVIPWYAFAGFLGLMGYETFGIIAKKQNQVLRIPVWGIVLFGLYSTFGFYLFITLFESLLDVNLRGAT